MDINKANWSMKDSIIRLSVPISKIDKERRIVTGFATLDNLDRQGDVVPRAASVKAFENFRGNIREMHQPIAVGKVVSFKEDSFFDTESKKVYNGIVVSAYVSKGAQDTWEKVLDGTLTGFSIGGEIHDSEKVFDEELGKSYQVIKEYSLSELSLVDNPANQFANVFSIEKGIATGYLSKTSTENVFWCRVDDIIRMSEDSSTTCPQCSKSMSNIGFVESNDSDKVGVVKSMISEIKVDQIQKGIDVNNFVKYEGGYGKVQQIVFHGGVRLSTDEIVLIAKSNDPVVVLKYYSQIDGTIVPTNRRVIKNISSLEKVNAISKSEVKEVSKMDSDIIVVDEIEKGIDMNQDQVNPEPTALPVTEANATVATEKAIEIEIEEEDKTEEDAEGTDAESEMGEDMKEEVDKFADAASDAEAGGAASSVNTRKSDDEMDVTTKMISEITNSLTSTLSTLADTVTALDAKIDGINKAVAGISNEVNEVKDKFGKRVDAVEKDTAFRKSADLGEILQEEPVSMQKSMDSAWGGRFLTNADLF